ncbi:DUF4998 domain-containing protein [Pedobacter sp. GR22-6]|uniref:DUF4998 domain-containing protein n=1 Tax=Pedobacter sp. GR22-6 TaxID=3127957 RepID=UPI00307E65DE
MKRNIIYSFVAVILVCMSCTKIDDYKKYTDGKVIVYPGKADSLKVYPGRNRAQLSWLLTSDPNIVKAVVYWNNKANHLDIPIVRGKGVDTIKVLIDPLPEGNYTFEVFTYNKKGDQSIVSTRQGASYGEEFEKSLLNRIMESAVYQTGNSSIVVKWRAADTTNLGAEIKYTTLDGQQLTKRVKKSDSQTILVDCKLGEPISYRTLFKPDSLSIDTFRSAYQSRQITELSLKNPGYPFIASKMSGRWGELAEWITNAAAKNMSGGVGGFDSYNGGGYIAFEFWGTPSITNGKIYQTLTLPAGSYRFVTTISEIANGSQNSLEGTYAVVALGNSLPDIANVGQSLGNFRFLNNSQNGKDYAINFMLSQQQEITIGYASTMFSVGNSSIRIRQARLYKN